MIEISKTSERRNLTNMKTLKIVQMKHKPSSEIAEMFKMNKTY